MIEHPVSGSLEVGMDYAKQNFGSHISRGPVNTLFVGTYPEIRRITRHNSFNN